MKKSLLSFGLASLAILLSSSYAFGTEINPSEISTSGCKGNGMPATRSSDLYDVLSWNVSYKDGKLTIEAESFLAICCPDGFGSKIDLGEGKAAFTVWEIGGSCDCYCPYDLTSIFEGVPTGKCELTLGNLYRESITVNVDLQEGFSQTFRIKETAIEAVSVSDGSLSFANGVVKAVSPGKFRLDVFGTNGEKEYSLEGADEVELSLGSLPHGVHFVRLTHAEGKISTLRISR